MIVKKQMIVSMIALSFLAIFVLTIPATSFQFSQVNYSLQTNSNTKSIPTTNKIGSLNSEEETIDSFSVNPKSGRWSTTDSNTNDYIVDGNLRNINSVNSSTTQSQYFAQRGLVKSDSKVEYRAKSSVSGNVSEYFRDQLGSSMTFDSSTQGWANYGGSTVTQSNGQLKTVTASSFLGVYRVLPSEISKNIFTNVSFDLYCTTAVTMRIVTLFEGVTTYGYYYKDFSCTTTLTSYNYAFSSFTAVVSRESVLFNYLIIEPSSAGTTYYLDNIKLLGSYDYATSVNGGPENAWDFEDSKEYFYDVYGNISDFNDGSKEGWSCTLGSTAGATCSTWSNANSNYGKIDMGASGDTNIFLTRASLSISASTYSYIAIEFNSSSLAPDIGFPITWIGIYDNSNTLVCNTSTTYVDRAWNLATCHITSGSWSGTETNLTIDFHQAFSLSQTIFINAIYLYDSSLGNVESWSNVNSNTYHYVDPTGYLVDRIATSSTANYEARTSLSIDTTKFRYLTVSIKADSSTQRYFTITNTAGGASLINAYSAGIPALTSSFQTLVYDLSLDSDWTGTFTQIYFQWLSSSGGANPIAGALYTIGYILLTADRPSNQQPFTIGFINQDTDIPLLNVTQYFWSSTSFQWRVLLFDAVGNTVAYYYSANQTYSDVYYRGKITYNVQKSLLSVELQTDGQTRLFKANYPDDFTVGSGTNAFFSMNKAPDIFFNTKASFIGASETWIDFINVPYKEKEWKLDYATSDSDWIFKSPQTSVVQPGLSADGVNYGLNIEKLDALSATLTWNGANVTATHQNVFGSFFRFYEIDKSTGTKNEVFHLQISVNSLSSGPTYFTNLRLYSDINGSYIYNYFSYSSNLHIAPAIDFSLVTTNSRSTVSLNTRFYYNTLNDSALIEDATASFDIVAWKSDASNEFAVYYENIVYFDSADNGKAIFKLDNFQFTSRDIFQDIVSGINSIGSSIINGIGGFFSWLGEIFKQIGLMLANIFKIAIDGLSSIFSSAISTLQSTLSGILNSMATSLSSILSALGSLAGDIATQLSTYFTDVVNAVVSAATDAIDYFVTQAGSFVQAVIDFLATIMNQVNTDIIQPAIEFIIGLATIILTILINLKTDLINLALNVLPFGIGSFVASFANLQIGTVISTFFDAINWVLTLGSLINFSVMCFLGLYMFGFPLLKNLDAQNHTIDAGQAIEDFIHNIFTLHGFDLHTGLATFNVTIPIRVNALIMWLFTLVLFGFLSVIWSGTLF